MTSVFLSYDRDDTAKARPIADALEKAGHQVWWDLHVRGGSQFSKVIEEALKAAEVVVVLWSANSIESPWVRDEAASGRDSGRLVPVTIDGTQPPLGFRQFQTIDLTSWRGRGKGKFSLLLEAVASFAPQGQPPAKPPPEPARSAAAPKQLKPRWLLPACAAALLLFVGLGWWFWRPHHDLPVVQVAPVDGSPRSRAVANDLFVKLGSLAQIGKGKWQLVDATSGHSKPDLVFRAADTGSPGQPDPNLVLLDGKDNSLLWSREFGAAGGQRTEADLRQQLSLTAGRILGCVLETRGSGGLRRDLLKAFLDGCAELAEASQDHPERAASALRAVVVGEPKFVPGWARLLAADTNVFSLTGAENDKLQLERDLQQAGKIAPGLPEITLGQTYLLPPTAYAKELALFAKAQAQGPDNPRVYAEENSALQRVGRMSAAIESARRAAELDPLSAAAETQLILTLAHGGLAESARAELQRAEKTWAGTPALRDAEYGFNLRYGDARAAVRMQPSTLADDLYIRAREDPSPQNIQALANWFKPFVAKHDSSIAGVAVQALAQFHQTDDVFKWLAMVETPRLATAFAVLFRPYLADVRNDPRFMAVAKRAGLTEYWRSSGIWPDFCSDPKLPYDCKTEAAKLH